jgi:hypothetical protein
MNKVAPSIENWKKEIRNIMKKDRDLIRSNSIWKPYIPKYQDLVLDMVQSLLEQERKKALKEVMELGQDCNVGTEGAIDYEKFGKAVMRFYKLTNK